MTLLCCYPPGSRAGLLGCLHPHRTLALSNSTSAGLLSGLLEHCSRKQIPRKQTLSLGNWNAVGSNKQTLCNEDLGLCSCQQVQQVLHVKSSWGLLAPKRETPQRSCHLRFHIVFPASHHSPPLSLWQESILTPFQLAKNTFPSCPTESFKPPNTVWEGAALWLQGSENTSLLAAVLAAHEADPRMMWCQGRTLPFRSTPGLLAFHRPLAIFCDPTSNTWGWTLPARLPHLITANIEKLSRTEGSLLAKETPAHFNKGYDTLLSL